MQNLTPSVVSKEAPFCLPVLVGGHPRAFSHVQLVALRQHRIMVGTGLASRLAQGPFKPRTGRGHPL